MTDLVNYIQEAFNNAGNGDEFYTRLVDIEKELSKFNLKGKIVYCNCDDPEFSKFWEYFYTNFKKLGLKHLIATYYDDKPLRYDYDGKEVVKTPIETGDFTKNGKVMDECDIVVTNPPFSNSYPEKLIEMCSQHKKDVIFVCSNNLLTKKDGFAAYKDGKINVDDNEIGKFDGPNAKTHVTCYWYTSLPLNKPKYSNFKEWDETKYPKYDNYDAVECGNINDIPDYDGNIGVPTSFAKRLNRDQFEIIELMRPKLNGKSKFARMMIKRK